MAAQETTPGPRRRSRGFRRTMRLVRGKDFQRAYREGSRARASKLLVVVNGNGLEHSRLGLSVGRRIWRQAVQRNRLRRLFREAFRLDYDLLPQGFDIVLIPAEPQLTATIDEVRAELVPLAAKAQRRWLDKRDTAAAKLVADNVAVPKGPSPR